MAEMIEVFEQSAQEYDAWFERHQPVYQSELLALQTFLPPGGRGLEIGVGTGRFAGPLKIEVGVEPAPAMAAMARSRGIKVSQAYAEELPFGPGIFDVVLMVTVLCFLKDPLRGLREAGRVLRPRGRLILGMIDPDTPLGRSYERKKAESKFYRQARFYPVRLVCAWLDELGFENIATGQTLVQEVPLITAVEPVLPGHGRGGFVVLGAQKR
ncbi:MAG: class I SAM-dependent methyltransferase [Thermodesulfobacteriota bacterium]